MSLKKIIGLLTFFTIFLLCDFFLTKVYKKIKDPNPLHLKKIAIKHPVYHHTFKSNSHLKAKFRNVSYNIYTNSLGFKDKQIREISKITDRNKRVIFIGDSFTEGVSLKYEDTFVGIIDEILNKKNIEVLNAGRGSYSPIIFYAKIKYLIDVVGLEFDEIIILPDLSDYADEVFNYTMNLEGQVKSSDDLKKDKRFNFNKKKKFNIKEKIRNNTTVLYYISNYIHDMFYGNYSKEYKKNPWFFLTTKKFHWVDKWTIYDDEYKRYASKGEKKMIKYMDKLVKLLQKKNIKSTIVVYPHVSQVWFEDLNSKHVKIWKSFSERNNINFIDLFPLFVETNVNNDKKIEILKENYITDDTHFNKKGNKKIANYILNNYAF